MPDKAGSKTLVTLRRVARVQRYIENAADIIYQYFYENGAPYNWETDEIELPVEISTALELLNISRENCGKVFNE